MKVLGNEKNKKKKEKGEISLIRAAESILVLSSADGGGGSP